MFVDRAKIYVKGGDGGNGSMSLRREKYIPRGGPDGGDGGAGGRVILVASPQISTLIDFHYLHQCIAEFGEDGSKKRSSGKKGSDKIIPVPIGTIIRDAENNIVGDLTEADQQQVVAKGGRGGRGNTHFKSPTHQTPYYAEPGGKGDEQWLFLELKLLADVGLVGLPNAGKSTLLSVLSNAKPKIANYPFTTLIPHLGIVSWGRSMEPRHFTVADIPGLIEGAHEGKGLGVQFLRHIERTTLILHLVSVAEGETVNPVRDLKTVRSELAASEAGLDEKPFMVAATKIDVAGKEILKLKRYCKTHKIRFFEISAATGSGIAPLITVLGRKIVAAKANPVPVTDES